MKPHWPALDGLRGVAICVVLAIHVDPHGLLGGWLGVDLFFALSGFLITGILLREFDTAGRMDLRAFYLRRALRLLPALLLMLAIWAVISVAAPAEVTGSPSLQTIGVTVLWALSYLFNWHAMRLDTPIPHLWSLSIEEQFYLLWPLLLLATLSNRHARKHVASLAVLLTLLSLAAPGWLLITAGANARRVYFGTDTHSFGLLAGSTAAILLQRGHLPAWLLTGRGAQALAWTSALALIPAFIWAQRDSWFWCGGLLPITLALVTLVVACTQAQPRVLTMRWLVYMGQRSYGLYLFHGPPTHWFRALPPAWFAVAVLLPSLAVAELSWRWVERPALALRTHRALAVWLKP